METWTPGPQRPLQTSLCSAVGWLPRGSSNSAGPRRDPQTSLTAIPASGDGKRKPETGAEGAAGGAKKKQKRVGPKGATSAYFYFTADVRERVTQENPDMQVFELAKVMGAECHSEPRKFCLAGKTFEFQD